MAKLIQFIIAAIAAAVIVPMTYVGERLGVWESPSEFAINEDESDYRIPL